MEEQEQIIVFKEFDNSIDANIIKTKLDAFDIPCFLTEENLVNLYPSMPMASIGVRLHVFQKDIDRVKTILEQQNLSISEGSIMCPKCGSNHITNENRNWINRIVVLILALLVIIPVKWKEKYTCLRCGESF